ncbi:S8 family peptidase [Luteimonas sp. MJ293]|uniref:S8 family peptidase n=1 Tax=Luteimonas sp. MJ146 TaxID=3129240 RepID=UPI0031BA1D7B
MNKHKISLAIGVILVAGAATPGAFASGPIPEGHVSEAPQADQQAAAGQRFVVKYRQPSLASDSRAASRVLGAAVSRAGLDRTLPAARGSSGRVGVSAGVLRTMAAPGWQVVRTSRLLTDAESAGFIRELSADPAVERVEVDQLYHHLATAVPAAAPDDPNYAQYQWNFYNEAGGVRAEEAWEISTGEGVVVAVLDTGITQDTLDLAANVIPGYDMISDARVSRRAADGRVAGGWDIGSWTEQDYCVPLGAPPHGPTNSSWHGTHVAGTIAQETNNGIGLAGIAPGAKVMPIRVLGSCGGFGSDISDAMVWAAGGSVPGLPDNENPAEVLNMSLGSSGPAACPGIYQDAIDEVNARGSIIVVAAGNGNASAGNYTMASCDGVISIGATGIAGNKAGYSNHGARVDLSAPGGGGGVDGNPNGYIWQVINGGTQGPVAGQWLLGGKAGTSMSSPHVAAAAAMVQSVVDMPLDWEQMRNLLTSTARAFPVAPPAGTPIGAGILDLKALLDKATEVPCDPEVEECEEPGIEATPIANKVPMRGLSGSAGNETLYALEVPAGVTGVLSITSSGGSGNASMFVSLDEEPSEDASDWRSTRPGNNETVRVNNPAAGTYFIKLAGSYSNLTLQGRFEAPENGEPEPGGNELENGVPVTGISGAASSQQFWTINVPAGTASLNVAMAGGTGDADLYVQHGAQPTATSYECRPYLVGNNETCTISSPAAGTWHVMIGAFTTFSGVSLTGSY